MVESHKLLVIVSVVFEPNNHVPKVLQVGVNESILHFKFRKHLVDCCKLLLFGDKLLLTLVVGVIAVDPHSKLSIFINAQHCQRRTEIAKGG
jgi:hypothetical protein